MTEEEDRLHRLLDQVADILQFLNDNKKKPLRGPIPPGVEDQITLLENYVQVFIDAQEKQLHQAGITDEELQKMIYETQEMSIRNQYLFDRAKKMEKEAREVNAQLALALSVSDQKIGKAGKEDAKQRKKKFKRIGSDKGWIPM